MKTKLWLIGCFITGLVIFYLPDTANIAEAHTHSDSCYYQCQGVDYNGDGQINYDDCISVEKIGQTDYFTFEYTTYTCRNCNTDICFKSKLYGEYYYEHSRDYSKLICDAVLTKIDAKYPYQVVYQGDENVAYAIATFSNGTTVEVLCSVQGYNPNALSLQSLTLSYTYGGITKTCTKTVNVIPAAHVHTDACYPQCQGIDYNGDGQIDYADCIRKEGVERAYFDLGIYGVVYDDVNWYGYFCRRCNSCIFCSRYCGDFTYEHSLDKTTPICPEYTTPPNVSFYNMNGNTVLDGAWGSYPVQIKVYDYRNCDLTCNYYLDGSATPYGTTTVSGTRPEKIVTFPNYLNLYTLSEGYHTIRVVVNNNVSRDPGEVIVTFRIDKSAPSINSVSAAGTTGSISLAVSASDAVSGLSAYAYRYTINGNPTDWLTTNAYTVNGLTPNTPYPYTVEVRDNMGHVSTWTGTAYTKSTTPVVSAALHEGNGIRIVVQDSNPPGTLYRLQAGSQYINAGGALSPAESWIALPYDNTVGGKMLVVSGLAQNTAYEIKVSARNIENGGSVTGNSTSVLTAPGIPSDVTAGDITSSQISLNWSSSAGAVSYEIYREAISPEGTVTSTKTILDIRNTFYFDNELTANQQYLYQIRCKNQYGTYSNWSEPLLAQTLPQPPLPVTGVVMEANGSNLDISWSPVEDVLGYEIEVISDGTPWKKRLTAESISYDTEKLNCQCSIKIRAFNVTQGDNPSDETSWTNAGAWSDLITCYTGANTPIPENIPDSQVTDHSAVITWDPNQNPESVEYILGIFKEGILKGQSDITGSKKEGGKLSYTINGLSPETTLLPETTYVLKLKARNTAKVETKWSSEVTITTKMNKPAMLTGLRASAMSDRIKLLWNEAERAQTYSVERDGVLIASDLTGTEYHDLELTSDTLYSYRVRAVNITGNSDWSAVLEKKTWGDLPAAPVIHTVHGTGINATVTWSSVAEVTGYYIEADGKVYNVGLSTSYEAEGLTPGSEHTYRVRTRNIYGKSEWSEPVTYKTIPNAPAAPETVSVTGSALQVRIQWSRVENATTYDLDINSEIHQGINALEYQYEPGVASVSGSAVTVRVRAVNQGGASDWSAAATALLTESTGSLPPMAIPQAPILSGSATGQNMLTVSWEEVSDAAWYQLEADGTIIYTGTNTSYIHTALSPDSRHSYRVRAGNSGGVSAWSNTVNLATAAELITAPQNISYYRIGDTTTAIVWDMVPGVDSYRVEINGVISEDIISTTTTEITTIPGNQYKIRVASVIIPGRGDSRLEWSDEIEFKTPKALPAIPVISKITAATNHIKVDWKEAAQAIGYELNLNGTEFDVGNALSYTITGLAPSASYQVKIRSYNEAGYGNWSETKTVMTNEEIAGVPANIMAETSANASSATGCAVKIKWDTVDGAETYEVEGEDGSIYNSNTNSIVMEDLELNQRYYFRVRAISDTDTGAWSSRISVVTQLMAPANVMSEIIDGAVRLSWNPTGGADYYEVELDDIIYTVSDAAFIDLPYDLFYLQRGIRIRACYETNQSDWSEKILFDQPLQTSAEVMQGEIISILLPYENADISNYQMTLSYQADELELLDVCELTPALETESTYISETNTYVVITQSEGTVCISLIIDDMNENSGANRSGTAGSIRFRSKTEGSVTVTYGVSKVRE